MPRNRARDRLDSVNGNGKRHYVSVDQAASYIGVNRMTIHKMLADGRLTPYRLGRRVLRIDLNEIDSQMAVGGLA